MESELGQPRILVGNTFPPDDLSTGKILLFAQVARFLVRTPKNLTKARAFSPGGLMPACLRIEKDLNISLSIDQKTGIRPPAKRALFFFAYIF